MRLAPHASDPLSLAHLLFVEDPALVGNGAQVSISRPSALPGNTHRTTEHLPRLATANRSTGTLGMCRWEMQLGGGGEPLEWKFVVAEIASPILGADFLAHHQLYLV